MVERKPRTDSIRRVETLEARMQALQVRRFKSRTTSAGLLLSTAIGLLLAQGAKTKAADYTNVLIPPNSTSVVNSGDTFTGTTGTALKLSRNVTLTLQNGPAPGADHNQRQWHQRPRDLGRDGWRRDNNGRYYSVRPRCDDKHHDQRQ